MSTTKVRPGVEVEVNVKSRKFRSPVSDAMTAEETTRFKEVVPVIMGKLRDASNALQEAGSLLMEVRDRRLYRETHDSFEAFCRDELGYGRNYVNKQIQAAKVIDALGTDVPTLPRAEAQTRALKPLIDVRPKLTKAWTEALDKARHEDREPTADDVTNSKTMKAFLKKREETKGRKRDEGTGKPLDKRAAQAACIAHAVRGALEVEQRIGRIDLDEAASNELDDLREEHLGQLHSARDLLQDLIVALEAA